MGRRTESAAGPSRPPRAAPKTKPPKPPPLPYTPGSDPDAEEQQSVHEVYERIAPHFAQTRYKPWPLVERFLRSLPEGTLGLDSGAGNGKYLPTARDAGLEMIALDRSKGLLDIAREEGGGECVRGDLIGRPWREGVFDILHALHLSSSPPYSRFMLYVWAFEQGHDSRRRMGAQAGKPADPDTPASDRPQDSSEGNKGRPVGGAEHRTEIDVPVDVPDVPDVPVQDVLVPWVMQKRGESSTSRAKSQSTTSTSASASSSASASAAASAPTRHGTTTAEVEDGPSLVLDEGKSAKSANGGGAEAGGNAPHTAVEPPPPLQEEPEQQVFHRYYHLFLQGELRELVEQAAREEGFVLRPARAGEGEGERSGDQQEGEPSGDGQKGDAERRNEGDAAKWLRVVDVGWEADNWWLEGEVGT